MDVLMGGLSTFEKLYRCSFVVRTFRNPRPQIVSSSSGCESNISCRYHQACSLNLLIVTWILVFLCGAARNAGHGLLILEVSISHTTTHLSSNSPARVIGPSQRSLPDNTQHSQETNIHVSGGIRTRNLRKRAAADPWLRPCGHWDRRDSY